MSAEHLTNASFYRSDILDISLYCLVILLKIIFYLNESCKDLEGGYPRSYFVKRKNRIRIRRYGLQLFCANISAFLLVFYTDVFGISAAAAGTMMLVRPTT